LGILSNQGAVVEFELFMAVAYALLGISAALSGLYFIYWKSTLLGVFAILIALVSSYMSYALYNNLIL